MDIELEIKQILKGKEILRERTCNLFLDLVLVLPLNREESYKGFPFWKVLPANFANIRFTRKDNGFVILTERSDRLDFEVYPMERYEGKFHKI